MSEQPPQSFDIIIAGGGATGLALAAILLKRTNLNIALIEASPNNQNNKDTHAKNDYKDTHDNQSIYKDTHDKQNDFLELRSIALSAQSCEMLVNAGLTKLNDIACPIAHIHVSDQGFLGRCTLHAQDYQLPALGQVVELPALVSQLQECVSQYADRLTPFYQSEIANLTRTESLVAVQLSTDQSLQAKLLVVAEGGQSPTRQNLGIDVKVEDYHQTALVANVELAEPHQHWAYERFTEQGPLALLPLPSTKQPASKHRSALVWTATSDRIAQLQNMSNSEFIDELQQQFGYRLGKLKGVGRRTSFPLLLSCAAQHIHHRAVLVGNACQSLHPIAGQGLNLALRDVQQLAELVVANQHHDIGEYQLLHRYQTARKQDQQRLITATSTLVHTFSNRHIPLVIGRNLALALLDGTSMIKSAFALGAMGFSSPADPHFSVQANSPAGQTYAKP